MNINKSLLYVAIVSLTISACSVEPVYNVKDSGLSFNVVLDNNPSTKAETLGLYSDGNQISSFSLEKLPETKSVQINHAVTFTEIYNSFRVEGRENGGTVFYSDANYNSATGLWDLQYPYIDTSMPSYLWAPGKQLEIVALASSLSPEATNLFFSGVSYGANPSTASFNYTLPDHADQQDFLVGYFKGVSDNGTISLKFNHALTSLVFVTGPLPSGVTLQVNSITLEGIDKNARCDITFGENTSYSWDAHSGTVNYTQVIDNPQPMNPEDVILGETASFIVIPRTFPRTSEARLLINITENGRTYDMYAPLAGQKWNPGETNTYLLSYHGENKALLQSGPSFNNILAEVTGSTQETYTDEVTNDNYIEIPNIKKIKFLVNNTDPNLTSSPYTVNVAGERPIYLNYDSASQTVTISTDDFEIYTNKLSNQLFRGLVNLTSIEGLEHVNTKGTTSFAEMFAFCKSLRSIDLSGFDTSNATNFGKMFFACETISSLNLSKFDTENVTYCEAMFRSAKNLRSVNFGDKFQMYKVASFNQMFACTGFVNLDLNFLVGSESLNNIQLMFRGCGSLQTVNLENLRSDNIYHLWSMFRNCIALKEVKFGIQTFKDVPLERRQYMFMNAATVSQSCKITCTEAAWGVISDGTSMSPNYLYPTNVTWTWIPRTSTP